MEIYYVSLDVLILAALIPVYSCEYQQTVEDFIALYQKEHLDDIPFWPPPDNAPGGCSCNIGRACKKEILIYDQLTACYNNVTNLERIGYDMDDSISNVEACNCCAESAIRSTIYDTCPNTKPSVMDADWWFNRILEENKWTMCRLYLDDYDCAGDLGYGAENAGGTQKFYNPGEFLKNGTETLYNTNGVVSTPVDGASFTWTYISDVHTVTVRSTDLAVTATITETGSSSIGTGTNSVETGTSSAKTDAGSTAMGMGVISSVSPWGLLTPLGELGLRLI
ncbi:uncharacterized protein N7498_010243 [Penicillium cinerascens]|uniref:Uncharacterized protein n=1 Tax=Penicillium cinerascens TaxID=70096 RepID=A0A9W9M708_9EURO|nr:uncharacterized protein N7498_010243 [Penicillium cinerascens]KAJ5191258.1 hypothetical protein N7498_010243 [Penicillium cinerascens]